MIRAIKTNESPSGMKQMKKKHFSVKWNELSESKFYGSKLFITDKLCFPDEKMLIFFSEVLRN